jgi:hypothetical protein
MAVNRLSELAAAISDNTKIVTDYLTSKGLSAPSFDIDGLDEFPIPSSDKEVFTARLNIIAATKELHDLAVGPKEGPMYLAWDVRLPCSIFGLVIKVPTRAQIAYPFMACLTIRLPKRYPSMEKSLTLISPRKST